MSWSVIKERGAGTAKVVKTWWGSVKTPREKNAKSAKAGETGERRMVKCVSRDAVSRCPTTSQGHWMGGKKKERRER